MTKSPLEKHQNVLAWTSGAKDMAKMFVIDCVQAYNSTHETPLDPVPILELVIEMKKADDLQIARIAGVPV